MSFFELKTPRDMFAKARREYDRMAAARTVDNVFNFFVTVYHVQDYVKATSAVSKDIIDAFLRDQDLSVARDLCDKGKHLTLTRRLDPRTGVRRLGALNTVAVNTLPLNGFKAEWWVLSGNRSYEIQALADSRYSQVGTIL